MIDPRLKDAIRQTDENVKALLLLVTRVREDNAYMKEQLRAIRNSVSKRKPGLLNKITGKNEDES